jgi:(p)ppGpp synthase/HD superfamily hydrolase
MALSATFAYPDDFKTGALGESISHIDSSLRDKAEFIAREAHEGQTRRDGSPYINHVEAVASRFADYESEIVAWLHDVVEDHGAKYSLFYLLEQGFPPLILNSVAALTRREDEDYPSYLVRVISAGKTARAVKIADIEHNISCLEPDRAKQREKYQLALMLLRKYVG